MEIIKAIVERIDEELEDADYYINCAYKVRDEYPELSAAYFRLSKEEMTHVQVLHDQVVRIIDNFKQTNEVPTEMKAIYDYMHGRHIEWAQKIEFKQKNYK